MRVEIITGRERRRRYTANEKLALVDATMQPGMTVSAVARLNGVSASLLERLLGRKTMEVEVLKAARRVARAESRPVRLRRHCPADGRSGRRRRGL